jgi:hypothetical protein
MDGVIRRELNGRRRKLMPGELAVMLDREIGENGLDGRRWRFFVTDGNRVSTVDTELSGSESCKLAGTPDQDWLEVAVERRLNGGHYRREWRLEEVVADGPINLRAEDGRPHQRIASAFS